MKKLRVLLVTHEDYLPPEDATEVPKESYMPWKTDFDVRAGLLDLGHDVRMLGSSGDVTPIRVAIKRFQPDVVFNLLESFHDVPTYDSYVTSYLELLRQPYTGCNPRGLLLTRDKALSRKILSYHRIPGPGFAVFPQGRTVRKPAKLRFPLLVKSLTDDGSVGVAQKSIVHSDEKLAERVAYLHETFATDVIGEEYVVGREMYVSVLGNRRLTVLPPIELVFRKLPEGTEPIATSKVKWDLAYQKKVGVDLVPAEVSEELAGRLQRTTKRIYRALGMSGYGRIDFRVTEEDVPIVIEANPNADLGYGEELHEAANLAGLKYRDLLQRILNLGMKYEAGWRQGGV